MSPVTETKTFFKIFSYSLTMLLQVFLPCYYGTELSHASDKVSLSVIHSDWVNQSKNFKSSMKIVVISGIKSLKVLAFAFVSIDFGTFSRICNAAYSMYALLQKINSKE